MLLHSTGLGPLEQSHALVTELSSGPQDESYLKRAAEKMPDVGRKMEYMLNTGNLVSRSGLDLSQATGFTVVAEKLNFYR